MAVALYHARAISPGNDLEKSRLEWRVPQRLPRQGQQTNPERAGYCPSMAPLSSTKARRKTDQESQDKGPSRPGLAAGRCFLLSTAVTDARLVTKCANWCREQPIWTSGMAFGAFAFDSRQRGVMRQGIPLKSFTSSQLIRAEVSSSKRYAFGAFVSLHAGLPFQPCFTYEETW